MWKPEGFLSSIKQCWPPTVGAQRKPNPAMKAVALQNALSAQPNQICYSRTSRQQRQDSGIYFCGPKYCNEWQVWRANYRTLPHNEFWIWLIEHGGPKSSIKGSQNRYYWHCTIGRNQGWKSGGWGKITPKSHDSPCPASGHELVLDSEPTKNQFKKFKKRFLHIW